MGKLETLRKNDIPISKNKRFYKMKFCNYSFFLLVLILCAMNVQSQELPYKKIPEAAKTFTPGSVVSRLLDGLGFRYYWATEGLRIKDLNYRPNKDARTSDQTLDHILGLSQVIFNSALHKENGQPQPNMTFEEKRKKTLLNIQKASEIFLKAKDLSKFKIVFKNRGRTIEYPFWNQINGPISDALWHVGQVVSFRRSSGNPFPKGVSVLRGVRREQ